MNGLTIDEKDTLLDSPEFLEGMWAVREGIEDASTSGDSAVLQLLQSTNTGGNLTVDKTTCSVAGILCTSEDVCFCLCVFVVLVYIYVHV